MKFGCFKLCSLFWACCYAICIALIACFVECRWGSTIHLLDQSAIPDYLGVCVAINLGLTFDYVQDAMRKPLLDKIEPMRNAAIAQLEDKNIDHSSLNSDLDRIERSNEDQCRDYSRMIRQMSYIWAVVGVMAMICSYWVKNWGAPNIIFLWPPIYFYICFVRHFFSIYRQVKRRLKCVNELETAESMKKKALEAIGRPMQ